jgi:hypothetical protein
MFVKSVNLGNNINIRENSYFLILTLMHFESKNYCLFNKIMHKNVDGETIFSGREDAKECKKLRKTGLNVHFRSSSFQKTESTTSFCFFLKINYA